MQEAFTQRLAEQQSEAHNELFVDLYGCTVFEEQKFLDGYDRFVRGVLEHFKNRIEDLLVINIVAGEGWNELCPFLGQPVPEIPFPKANVTQITWMKIEDVVAVAKRAGQLALQAYQRKRMAGPIGRAWHVLRGGDSGARQRVSRLAHKTIVEGLKNLTAQIPVLSRNPGLSRFPSGRNGTMYGLLTLLTTAMPFLERTAGSPSTSR